MTRVVGRPTFAPQSGVPRSFCARLVSIRSKAHKSEHDNCEQVLQTNGHWFQPAGQAETSTIHRHTDHNRVTVRPSWWIDSQADLCSVLLPHECNTWRCFFHARYAAHISARLTDAQARRTLLSTVSLK